jgi:hypothetical protein
MVKRSFLVLMVLSLFAVSNESHASRARLIVMGSGDAGMFLDSAITAAGTPAYGGGGSMFYNDPYNMFYNPAYVNDYKDWAIVEKSNFVGPNATTAGTTAQGGFVMSMFNFNIGLFMNRIDGVRTLSAASATATRPIELIIGADMGIKWGLGVMVASRSTSSTVTDQIITVKAGVSVADFEPFAHFSVGGQDQTAGTNNHQAMSFGMRYHWGEWTPYAAFRQDKTTTVTTSFDNRTEAWGVGLGRESKVAEGVKTMYSLSFMRATSTLVSAPDHSMVPINFAVEGEAASWLTLRAGVTYAFYDKSGGNSVGDTTTGRLGASIKVGKAALDFAFASAPLTIAGAANEASGITAQSVDAQRFDMGAGLFTAASLSYKW